MSVTKQSSLSAKHRQELQQLQLQQLEELLAFELSMERDARKFRIGDRVVLQIGQGSAQGVVVGGPHFDGSLNVQTDTHELHLYCEVHRVDSAAPARRDFASGSASSQGLSSITSPTSTLRHDGYMGMGSCLQRTPQASPDARLMKNVRQGVSQHRLARHRLATPDVGLMSQGNPAEGSEMPSLCLHGGVRRQAREGVRVRRIPSNRGGCPSSSVGTGRSVEQGPLDALPSRLDGDVALAASLGGKAASTSEASETVEAASP
eukprot:TRINITY_DN4931_c0_g1_i1.p1 TRINITY_DN4931_c0_g1~~TRINITY_DN4931_c0_g1_i1.p1  ORF type:complete len:262 (+),score=40.58 TRINITY_DN4931_c0_g1_i1:49-834(+)